MANPKHTIHVGIAVIGAIRPVDRVGRAFPIATGGTTGIGYWLSESGQLRHG